MLVQKLQLTGWVHVFCSVEFADLLCLSVGDDVRNDKIVDEANELSVS
jgi:hypothetical protein